jgi:DNA-binding MarR family transcriptional regulator
MCMPVRRVGLDGVQPVQAMVVGQGFRARVIALATLQTFMSDRPSQLEDHTGCCLRCLSNPVHHAFAGRLDGRGISVPQWVMLRILYDRENGPRNELAAAVGADNGALSRTIERLWQKGLIVREIDPWNRRAVRLRLTEAGDSLVPVLATEADRNDQACFGVIGVEERRQFLKTVRVPLAKNDWRSDAQGNATDSVA